jgi:DNA replication protein DnaC
VQATQARRLRGRLRLARYPIHKTLADFDFDFQPSLDRAVMAELSTEAGYRTYFISAADLVANLQSAHLEGTAAYKMRTYTGPSVLVIDELGYLPLDQTSANWIFQVVSRRYERGSVVLTSNRRFADRGQAFADQVVAGAIVDRLIHNATVLNVRGHSYRTRNYVDAQTAKGGDAAKVR